MLHISYTLLYYLHLGVLYTYWGFEYPVTYINYLITSTVVVCLLKECGNRTNTHNFFSALGKTTPTPYPSNRVHRHMTISLVPIPLIELVN